MAVVGITLESPARLIFDSNIDEIGRRIVKSTSTGGLLDDGTAYRSLGPIAALIVSVSETPTATDVVTAALARLVNIFDASTLTESATLRMAASKAVFDAPLATDSATVLRASAAIIPINVADQPAITESVTVRMSLSVFDTPIVTDSATVIGALASALPMGNLTAHFDFSEEFILSSGGDFILDTSSNLFIIASPTIFEDTAGTDAAEHDDNIARVNDADGKPLMLSWTTDIAEGPTYQSTSPVMALANAGFNGSTEYLRFYSSAGPPLALADLVGPGAKTIILSLYVEAASLNESLPSTNHGVLADLGAWFGLFIRKPTFGPVPTSVWDFESSGNDSVGANNLTNNGSITFAAGKVSNAAQIGASGQFFSIANNPSMSVGDTRFGFTCWVKLNNKSATKIIVRKVEAAETTRGYQLIYNAGSDRFEWYLYSEPVENNGAIANNLGSPSIGIWYFLACWHDPVTNTINIQVNNGAINSTAHSAGGMNDTANPFLVGALSNGSLGLNGAIDQVCWWNGSFPDASSLTSIYNDGNGRPTSAIIAGGSSYEIFAYNWDVNADTVPKTISLSTSYVVTLRHDGTNLYLGLNGGSESSIPSGLTGNLSAQVAIGRGASNFAQVRIGEIAIYNAALTGSILAQANQYFTSKWLAAPISVLTLNISDNPAASDSAAMRVTALPLVAFDQPTVSDAATIVFTAVAARLVNIGDQPTTSESAIIRVIASKSVFDAPTATDVPTVQIASPAIIFLNITDGSVVTDSVTAAVIAPLLVAVADQPTVFDGPAILLPIGSVPTPADGTFTVAAQLTVQFLAQGPDNAGTFTAIAQLTTALIGAPPPSAPMLGAENPKRVLLRVTEARIGANGIVELDLVREDLAAYYLDSASPVLGSAIHGGAPISPLPPLEDHSDQSRPGSTRPLLLDIPQLRFEDDGPGFYAAATGISDGWAGALLFQKQGGEFVEIAQLAQRATIGTAKTRLDSGPVTIFDLTGRTYVFDDVSTVDISLVDDVSALVSVTDDQMLSGANGFALGHHGRWEIASFGTATQLDQRIWRLSHLLRGMKGTEWAVDLHGQGDHFVLLDSAIRRVSHEAIDLDVQKIYRAVSIGNDLDSASNLTFTNTGVSQKPLSPVFIRGEEDGAGNRVIRWYRRSRLDGFAGRDAYSPPPPLGETFERYEVEILNAAGTTILRTITTAAELASYTAAQQTADHGSVPSSLKVCVYQLSESRGRGYANCTTVALFDALSSVLPTILPYIVALTIPEQPRAIKYVIHPPPLSMFFPAGFSGSRATLEIASAGSPVFSIRRNGIEVGTITFNASTAGVFAQVGSGDISLTTTDKLILVGPPAQDTTASGLGVALLGYRMA
jgi:hypothetical protein